MFHLSTTRIDEQRCIGCGACASICPTQSLAVVDGTAAVVNDRSLQCGQCAAVCPSSAITVTGIEPDALALASIPPPHDALVPYGKFDISTLFCLMQSRRSCRLYSDAPVDKKILEDLVKIGSTAPSGTNSQLWTFTVLPHRAAVERLAKEVSVVFEKVNRLAQSRIARLHSKIFSKGVLGKYYREHYETVKEAMRQWNEEGRDRLFHGATAVMLIGMKPGASCPCEDAAMASQNILLAAHAMGLGTCMVGFAVAAMKRAPEIKLSVGIPQEETIYSAIALGIPTVRYLRPAGRKKPVMRYAD
ncbi:MAG: nitroreductase family protein [Myxococcota bacterium]|nr:nitroreductase family protein [Myxococcota bacterium]